MTRTVHRSVSGGGLVLAGPVSAPVSTVPRMQHHPWRAFRDLVDWTLVWAPLPFGVWGQTDFEARVVTLAPGLSQAERRCTIAHETEHILRGPVPVAYEAREELEVDRNVARLLLPDVRVIGEALAWAHNVHEAADELWVDQEILRARLKHLHPSERAYLKSRLVEDN